MIPKLLLLCLLFNTFFAFSIAQPEYMMVYDLEQKSLDSIPLAKVDTSTTKDQTWHHYGMLDQKVAFLEEDYPTDGVFPNSSFTIKKRASIDYSIRKFPIRTTVKIFSVQNDTLVNNCSGTFISKRHILTAAHCLFETGSNTPRSEQDTLLVCPVYDEGHMHQDFDCGSVVKAYSFKNWKLDASDFVILELSEPIGKITGWMGIGFNQSDEELKNHLYYKFSYPNESVQNLGIYNGDTLYYAYGKMDITKPNYLGIENTICDFGESGSSLFRMENEQNYTSYATLTYGNNCLHNRITKEVFYPLKAIIESNLTLRVVDTREKPEIYCSPNPGNGIFKIHGIQTKFAELALHDQLGRLLITFIEMPEDGFNISNLPNGIYFLKYSTHQESGSIKIIKQ